MTAERPQHCAKTPVVFSLGIAVPPQSREHNSGSTAVVVRRYGSRNWAVYEDGELLCVTVYKKGAVAVAQRIEELTTGVPHLAATPEAPCTPVRSVRARKGTDEAKKIYRSI